MKSFIKSICVLLLLLITHIAFSQDTIINTRPKVGLVLSGGGAKGAAHIGVLKYIEEVGLPIDYIAGTSMGSVVGGLYALGYSSDEILDIISNVDWNRLMSNNVDRKKISYRKKCESITQLIDIPFYMRIDEEDIQSKSFRNSLPEGIVSGDNIINLFNSLSVGYSDSIAFDELPIPFICVATNLINGEADVLDKGMFTKSLRASMAIPILFDPIKIGDVLYVDGGLVSNFPVEQCRAMGADYIIGVSMSPGLEQGPDNLTSIISQVKQLKEIITDKDYDKYHESCDIFISPDLKGVGMLSFDAKSIAKVTESGYEAALRQEEDFKMLKDKIYPEKELQHQLLKTSNKDKALNVIQNKVLLSGIEFNGVEKAIEKRLRYICTVEVGDSICKNDIDETISIYYGTGNYSSITYTLHKDEMTSGAYVLKLDFVESPPHNLALGFRFDTQDMLSVLLHMGINNNRVSGFKADLDAKLGGNQWLKMNLSYGKIIYPRINFAYNFRNSELDVYDMDVLDMNVNFLQHKFRLYLSENYTRTFSIGAGLETEFLKNRKVMYSLYDAVDMDYKPVNTLGAFAYICYDNLNKNRFPTRGVKGRIDFAWKDKTFDSDGLKDLDYGSLVIGFEGYVPIKEDRVVLIPQLYGSMLFGKGSVNGISEGWNTIFEGPVPCYPSLNNILGGTEMSRYIDQQLPFIGLNKMSFAFNDVVVLRTDIRVRLFRSHYLTTMVNYGRSSVDLKNFFKEREELQWGELYDYNASNWWGAGLRYSIDTKVGPLSFDVVSSNISHKVNLYFSWGYFF